MIAYEKSKLKTEKRYNLKHILWWTNLFYADTYLHLPSFYTEDHEPHFFHFADN